ncbi:MAG: SH3 domain-containing protein [Cyanobacteria bacterium J06627_15]
MAVKQFAVGLTKFVLGVFLALVVIGLAGVSVTKYFLTRLTYLPERPVYSNDSPAEAPTAAAAPDAADTAEANPPQPFTDAASATPVTEPEPEPEPEPQADVLYEATVVQAIGLLVRSGPGAEHGQLGGVDFQDQLEVLEESNGWLRVRSDNGQEGWVKGGGNVQRSN